MSRLQTGMHPSLTEDVLRLLYAKRVHTIINFIDADVNVLSAASSLTRKEILDIKSSVLAEYAGKTLNACSYYKHLLRSVKITATHIKPLDALLDGGIQSDYIYEICGPAASGKTHLCTTIAANISQYHKKHVHYIDTKSDFSARNITNMLRSRNVSDGDVPDILNRIIVWKAFDRFQLSSALQSIKSDCDKIALVIIDSLPPVFYHVGDFNDAISYMNEVVGVLRFVCRELNVPVLLVNIFVNRLGLVRYWEGVPNVRLHATRDGDACRLSVAKSLCVKAGTKCECRVTEAGVV